MKIVIIGAGYAGCDLAKAVQDFAEVVLIDPKESFLHCAGMLRGMVDEKTAENCLISYKNFLPEGQFIQAKVTEVLEGGVLLENGEKVFGDVIVVTTGSYHNNCFKVDDRGLDQFRLESRNARDLIGKSQKIAIVGSGAVGTELAGELAAASSSKDICLITDQTTLFPSYSRGLHNKLVTKLNQLGVEIHFGSRAKSLSSWTEPHEGNVELESGQILNVDLVIPATGSRPNNQLLKTIHDVQFDIMGRAETDGLMRPSPSRPNLFTLGDVASLGEGMTIVAISRQVPWLAKALKALSQGGAVEAVAPYKPWPVAPIILPLGAEKGASILPFGKKGLSVGDFLTRKIKGEHLFLGKYRKLLNA